MTWRCWFGRHDWDQARGSIFTIRACSACGLLDWNRPRELPVARRVRPTSEGGER